MGRNIGAVDTQLWGYVRYDRSGVGWAVDPVGFVTNSNYVCMFFFFQKKKTTTILWTTGRARTTVSTYVHASSRAMHTNKLDCCKAKWGENKAGMHGLHLFIFLNYTVQRKHSPIHLCLSEKRKLWFIIFLAKLWFILSRLREDIYYYIRVWNIWWSWFFLIRLTSYFSFINLKIYVQIEKLHARQVGMHA